MQREMTFALPNIEPNKPTSERDPHIIVRYEDNGSTDLWSLNECVSWWVVAAYRYKNALLDTGDCSLSAYKKWWQGMIEQQNRGVAAAWQETNYCGDVEVNVRDVTKFECAVKVSIRQLRKLTRGRYL